MHDVTVIDHPAAAEALLDPVRSRLLSELTEPASAAALARRIELPRQKINYHLRTLEQHGLIELVTERRKGNVMERLVRTTARSYVISPRVLSGMQPDPGHAPDRLSARWLLAVASRLMREVSDLITGADRARKRVATFTLDGEITFASAADRAAFATELADAVTSLVSKYHDASSPGGREHRIMLALHPVPPDDNETEKHND